MIDSTASQLSSVLNRTTDRNSDLVAAAHISRLVSLRDFKSSESKSDVIIRRIPGESVEAMAVNQGV